MSGITYAIIGTLVFLCAAVHAIREYRVSAPAVDIAAALVFASSFAAALTLLIRLLWKAMTGV